MAVVGGRPAATHGRRGRGSSGCARGTRATWGSCASSTHAYETQLLEAERQRKEEARAEAVRVANEEGKATKAATVQTRAAERRAFEIDFRQGLVIPHLFPRSLPLLVLFHHCIVPV